jgi:colanic acid biosynthesis glycosyl transferase WcaI
LNTDRTLNEIQERPASNVVSREVSVQNGGKRPIDGLDRSKRKKILILGLNYLPESTSIGPYTADLAEYLLERGHEVHVVTGFPSAPQWKIWDGYTGKLFMREVIHGVPVTRTYLYIPTNPKKAIQRILFDCSFAVSSFFGVWFGKRPDLVIAISPPLQVSITAYAIRLLTGARVFLEIKDLVPDAAIAVGAMREDSRAVRIARGLERFAYRTAELIGVICEGMRTNLVSKGVPAQKVELLPDYINLNFMKPVSSQNNFRERIGVGKDQFLAMYSGSVAGKQGLETFVKAAAAFEGNPTVACCVTGEGPYLSELKKTANELGLRRFQFLPLQPRETLPDQLSSADVLVITQRAAIRDVVFPGKLLYYMSSGRPILASVSEDSETGRFIRDNAVGMVVPPERPDLLAAAICWMQAHPEELRQFGLNGRRVVETQFDRNVVLNKFAAHIERQVVKQ